MELIETERNRAEPSNIYRKQDYADRMESYGTVPASRGRVVGCRVGVGMLRGAGPSLIGCLVRWFLLFFCFLASWFLGFKVYWFQRVLASWFLGCWFIGFKVSKFIGFRVSKINLMFCWKIWYRITKFPFHVFRKIWVSNPRFAFDILTGIFGARLFQTFRNFYISNKNKKNQK